MHELVGWNPKTGEVNPLDPDEPMIPSFSKLSSNEKEIVHLYFSHVIAPPVLASY